MNLSKVFTRTAITTPERQLEADADLAVVRQVQAGDVAAFDRLIVKYRERVFGVVYNLVANREDAADLSQDTFIAAQYSAGNIAGKRACKRDLLENFRLPADSLDRPLIGIVSRFADQKGFDLIAQVAEEMLRENLAIVALGTGDKKYEQLFASLAEQHPSKVGVRIAYDNAIAHKIEAGADMFLMPSRYEPCGLNQIYSLRYGTVPVVRATGGLDDTIEPFEARTGRGTGFKFEEYTGRALLDCLRQALKVYHDPKAWRSLMGNGMAQDFSWKSSAAEYVKLYDTARKARIPRTAAASNQGPGELVTAAPRRR